MRQLIIDLSTEKNQFKKNQILEVPEGMGIEYQASERQSVEEYNNEISEAEDEIAKGEFITAENLKKKRGMVTWSKAAKVQLQKAFHFISNDSPQNAEKIINNIVDITIGLSKHPEIYPADKYKKNNTGNYRAFEIYHYRISYRVLNDSIYIVPMRHTSMSPLVY